MTRRKKFPVVILFTWFYILLSFIFYFLLFLLFLLGTRDLRLKSESVVNTHFAFWQKEVKSEIEIEIVLFPTILANATFMFANLTLMQTNKKPLFLELHILMYCFLVKRQFKMKITKTLKTITVNSYHIRNDIKWIQLPKIWNIFWLQLTGNNIFINVLTEEINSVGFQLDFGVGKTYNSLINTSKYRNKNSNIIIIRKCKQVR